VTAATVAPIQEIARRAEELYEREIRAKVEDGNIGRIIVIDVESGDYEIADDHLTASHSAHAKHPQGVFFVMRIGYPALGKVGGGWGDLARC